MLNNAALVLAANAVDTAITHLQLHSAVPDAAYGTNVIGTRVAVNGTVDADGDITWANAAFTGLPANSPVWGVSYWSAGAGGTNYGGSARTTGDTAANAAGEYTLTSVTETSTAS